MPSYDADGYPSDWTPEQREFWDNEPATSADLFDDEAERHFAMHSFEEGWMHFGIPMEEIQQARDDFYEITGLPNSAFDWGACREFLQSVDTPSLRG